MAKGVTTRSLWQDIAKRHTEHAKNKPEWMGQANEALKPWGDQQMTLQHALAVALEAAYEAGARGEYPKPIAYFDRFKEEDREAEDNSSGSSRIMRRTRTPPPESDVADVGVSNGVVHHARRTRTLALPAESGTGGNVHGSRIVRSRPAAQPQGTRLVRTRS